jgi:HAD superfamily hydrolase (TIGR01509 family)
MSLNHIETLFLDAGSVMVHPNWWRISDTLGRHGLPVAPEALRDADPPARFAIDQASRIATTNDAERGGIFLHSVLDRAGVPRGAARDAALTELYTYHMAHNLWEHVPDDVRPALDRLAAAGLRLVVASNANGALTRMFDRVGLTPYFHTICDSHVEGVEKPDPRFFRVVLERCGGTAATTVHVGDLYHVDVVGARNAGLGAMLFDPHDLYGACDVDRIRSLDELVVRAASTARPARDRTAS